MGLTTDAGIRLRAGEVLTPDLARQILLRSGLRGSAELAAGSAVSPPTVTLKEVLWSAATEARARVAEYLVAARGFFASGQRGAAAPLVETGLAELNTILATGIDTDDPLLSYYYAAKLMRKFLNVPDNAGSPQGDKRRVVQVLVFDPNRQAVLLQRRGPFKRMFADTFCVSANGKLKQDEALPIAAARAVKDEVGLEIDPNRVELVGAPEQYGNHLTSCNFYAFSREEELALSAVATALGKERRSADDVVARYNQRTRALEVFSTNPLTDRARLAQVAERVSTDSGVPPIFAFSNTDTNSLVAYQLNEREQAAVQSLSENRMQARSTAAAKLPVSVSGADLKALDSDEMHFVPWFQVRCEASARPEEFAQVLTGPYFEDDATWAALGLSLPPLLGVDDPACALPCVAGGKGAGLHVLQTMTKRSFQVPDTSVLTTLVYEAVVLADGEIRAEIESLDLITEPEQAGAVAAGIRAKILALDLPGWLEQLIVAEFHRLGGDVAVRSAATSEDHKEYQAAGQADTDLHVVAPAALSRSVKRVWASLFNDGFVAYRRSVGFPHRQARMAVLLESFVEPDAAGVIFSFDQQTQRPGYSISAQPGLGEGVVEGLGLADRWFVGSLCDHILQRIVPVKTVRVKTVAGGGVEKETIALTESSLADAAILALAAAAKEVHLHYRSRALADDVDIEYVVGKGGAVFFVQARAKKTQKSVDSDGRTFIKIKTVDEGRLAPETAAVQLDERSETAVPGAVTAPLQLDPDRQPGKCLPGRILVAHHTNNDYNAVFGSLAGVIATDGGQTSHASEHAFEKKIPCVVGSLDALRLLEPFDGQLVTFDATRQRLYLGAQPIVEEERTLSIWLTDEAAIAGFVDEGSRHENLRSWAISKQRRPLVFIEDPECHCRRRSGTYSVFHVDGFYRAWDRQAEILNRMFGERRPWSLVPQKRQIKAIGDKHQLVHIVDDDDPRSVYRFLMGVRDFGLADLERLFEARLDGFRKFAAFAHSLTGVGPATVERLVDEVLDVYSWMHFGFWLDSVVEEFAFRQLRYISNEGAFHKVLREEAVADLPRDYRVDPQNSGLPAGTILNLTRQREREINALLETVRRDARLCELVAAADAAALEAEFPEVLTTIETWSERYKLTREDFDVLSDTAEYLADLRRRLAGAVQPSGDAPHIDDGARRLARQVLAQYPEIKRVLTVSRQQFALREDAHHLIVPLQRIIAREMIDAARCFVPGVLGRPEDVFRLALEEFIALFRERDPGYLKLSFQRWPLLLAAEQELKKCWTVDKDDLTAVTADVAGLWQELTYERGGQGYLDDRGFAQDRLLALRDWREMSLSAKFEPLKQRVFCYLRRPLDNLPAGLAAFEAATEQAIGMIELQFQAATLPRVRDYYRAEQARLRLRVAELKSRLLGGDDHGDH